MSGAGRSTAARALEDLGWFVIDNLPPSVLNSALNDVKLQGVASHIAVVVDLPAPDIPVTIRTSGLLMFIVCPIALTFDDFPG